MSSQLLSETGGGNTASCETAVAAELAYLKAHSDLLVGFTIWSAGAFDSSYARKCLKVFASAETDPGLQSALSRTVTPTLPSGRRPSNPSLALEFSASFPEDALILDTRRASRAALPFVSLGSAAAARQSLLRPILRLCCAVDKYLCVSNNQFQFAL
jgi:hypothetical protein